MMSTTPTEILETTLAALETTAATATAAATDATGATESALDIQSIKDMMDAFDPAAYYAGADVEGDLSIQSNVNTAQAGSYYADYYVTNGARTGKTRLVVVVGE